MLFFIRPPSGSRKGPIKQGLTVLQSGHFHGVVSSVFSKFSQGARNAYEVLHDRAGFSGKIYFAPKIGKMERKQGFFNLLENLVINFYWICSVMEIYIICCVPAQIPYLRKFLFMRCGTKCPQLIRLLDFLINHIFRTNQRNSLIFCVLVQIQINEKLIKKFWGGHSQRWVCPAWSQNSKIDCISRMSFMEWTDFLRAGVNSEMLKVISMIFGWMWSKLGAAI